MRVLKLLFLAALACVALWLMRRRGERPARAGVGYDDGSSITLEEGSPELERLVAVARRALGT